MSKKTKNSVTSKVSAFTMLGLTIAGPVLTAGSVLADEVQSYATNYKDGQKVNEANKASLAKASQNTAKATELTVPDTVLTDAVNKYKGNVNLTEAGVVDKGTFKQSDTAGIEKATAEINADYQKQASEIKALSDKYEADLKFYNDNKQAVETLAGELSKLAQESTKLGAKIDKGNAVTGKSFQEIQEGLKTQIESMKKLVATQQASNTSQSTVSADYDAKVAEIKKLEAQLEELAQKGSTLGATISKNQVTDSKTLDEIKTLLAGQVATLSEIVKKQEEVNKKFEADSKAYEANAAEVAKLTKELNDAVGELSKVPGVAVHNDGTESGKTFDEIKANLKSQIAAAKTKKTEAQNASNKTITSEQEYLKAKAKYDTDLAEYKKEKAKYDSDKKQYDTALIKYNADKAKYDEDKVKYAESLRQMQNNTGTDGYLSQAVGQSLIFKSEPNATANITLGSSDDYFIKRSAAQSASGDIRSHINSSLWNRSIHGTTNQEEMLILDKNNQVTTSPYYMVDTAVGHTTTVNYNLYNTTFNGKKVSKLTVKYTPELSSANDNRMVLAIHKDPTVTVWFGSAYDKKGIGNKLKMEYQYFYEDGTPVEFSEDNKGIVSFASRNNHGDYAYAEDFGDLSSNMSFIKITGSSIDRQSDGRFYSATTNNSFRGGAPYAWDSDGGPYEYWGAGAASVNSGSKFSFTVGTTKPNKNLPHNIRQWFVFNTDVKANVAVKPVEPVKPKEPKEPKEPTPPQRPEGNLTTTDFGYKVYENPAKPTKDNLSGSYSSIVVPKKPSQTTGVNGSYNEFTIPNPPQKPSYAYHRNVIRTSPDAVKEVKDSDGTDVNNQVTPKSSTITFDLKVNALPANRPESKEFTITDALPQGAKFLKDATVAHPNNKNWDITFDEKTDVVTFKPKAEYIKEFNKNLGAAFEIQSPTIVTEVQNDDAVYENNFIVKHNDNEYSSNIVKVVTPTPPTITNGDNGDGGGSKNKNRKEKPLKAVNDDKGNDINNLNVKTEDTVYYNLTWSNENYKGIKASVKEVADGFFYAEDIDEKAVTPLLDQLEVTVKATGEKVEGVHAEYYESLEKAPKEVQDKYKQQGIEPKGGFVHIWVDDEHEAEHNAKYKVTGQDLNIKFPVKVNKDFAGQFENTAYQSDYGNGYKTNTVKNNVPVQKTDKFVTTGDKVDVTKLTDKDKVKEIPKRKDNYNWVVKNTLDKYSVENGLYKELALNDSSFADVQTADKVSVMDSKGNDVTSETNIEVWVDGKLYSVNGTLSNQTIADNADVTDKTVRGDEKTNDKKLLSKDKNLLLPDNLNIDGKKNTVEIKAVFKDTSKVKDTTYYTVYQNVNTVRANASEIKNYVVDGDKLEIENKARIDYKFKFDETWNKTTESNAKVRISVVQPKEVKTTKYVTKGKVDVTKLTDADKATSIASQLDKYNWIIKAELNKDSVANNAYKSLSIVDKEFADVQSVTKATLRNKDGVDITSLVDIQVWQDDKLYSVNGQEGTEAKTESTGETNVLLPKDLNKDGKKANVQIKAVFKNPEEIDQTEYYLAFENVSYADASEQEIKNYKSGDNVKVGNVANAEYAGTLDEDGKVKKTPDTKADLEQKAPKPLTPEKKKTPNTRWVDEQYNKLKEPKDGLHPDKEGDDVEGWTLVRIENDKDGNVINVYRKVKTPNTRWVDEQYNKLKETQDGLHPDNEGDDVEGWTLVRVENDKDGNVINVYRKNKTPNTRWVDEQNNPLKDPKDGSYPDKEGDDVEGWTLVRTDIDEEGNVVNVYRKVLNTRWVDEQGNQLKEPKQGTYPDKEGDDVEGWTLVRVETDKDGNVTNVYRKTPKVAPKNPQKFAPTGVADVAKYGFLATAVLSVLGLFGYKKFKRSEDN